MQTLTTTVNTKAAQTDLASIQTYFDLTNDLVRNSVTNTLNVNNLRVHAPLSPVPGDQYDRGLFFSHGSCSEQMMLTDDGRLAMTPAATSAYRFGSENDQTGSDRNQHDGINMYSDLVLANDGSAAPAASQTTLNQLQIVCCPQKPMISIKSKKTSADDPIVDIRTSQNSRRCHITENRLEFFNSISQIVPTITVNGFSSNISASSYSGIKGPTSNSDFAVYKRPNNLDRMVIKRQGGIFLRTVDTEEVDFLECKRQVSATSTDTTTFKVSATGEIDCQAVQATQGVEASTLTASTSLTSVSFKVDGEANERPFEVFNSNADMGNSTSSLYILRDGKIACNRITSRDSTTWRIEANGSTSGLHVSGQRQSNASTSQSARKKSVSHNSMAVGANSMYVGNFRISYDMANRLPVFQKLKANHIPTYLQAHVTANDLPTGHALEHMTVIKWLDLARDEVDDTLDLKDVFPDSNTGDWDLADAPSQAVTTLQNAYTGLDADITTLETEMDAVEVSVATKQDTIVRAGTCYVDAKRSDAYTEDGSISKPYKTLSAAITARCEDADTDTVHFVLASGTYSGAIDRQKTTANQSITIQGAGPDHTVITGGAVANNIVYLRRFREVKVLDCTFETGAYGFYLRDARSCVMTNCHFVKCGSVGTSNRHDLTGTQAEQATYWGSVDTSDGGACRIRTVARVRLRDCRAEYCLRGFRIQDCGSVDEPSSVQGCEVYRCLESGIYLAAGTYTGASGCNHFKVSGNTVRQCFNNGILVIGGKHNSVVGNTVSECANAGIMLWHQLDATAQGNVIKKCNQLAYNGIGNAGDAHASLHVEGSSAIGTGHCIASVHGNTMIQCGQGAQSEVRGISIMKNGSSHPAASNKCFVGYNRSDAAVPVHNPTSVVLNQPSSGGGSDLSAYSTTAQMNTQLALKNDLIGDGDLTIARTNNLQATLTGFGIGINSKQAIIGDGDLSIARTSGLQAAIDGKMHEMPALNTIPVWPDVLNSNSTPVPTHASLSHYSAANGGHTTMAADYAQLWSHNSGPKGVECFTRSQVELMMWEDLDDINNSVRTRSDTPWCHVPYVYLPYKRMRIRVIVNRDRTGAGIYQQTGSSTSYLYLRVRSPHIKPGSIMMGTVDLSDVGGEHWSGQNLGLDIKRVRHGICEAQCSWAIRNYSYWPPSADRNHSNGGDGFTTGSELYMDIQIF